MLEDNLSLINQKIKDGNNLGEKITLLGATKFVSIETVNKAISLGLTAIGENKAQEFRDKFPFYSPCEKHFIGTLQLNKLKYVVGKADYIDSVSNENLAVGISEFAKRLNITQKVMIEINAGDEQSKTGISLNCAKQLYDFVSKLTNIKIVGIMAMLPKSDDSEYLAERCREVRAFYDGLRVINKDLAYLSMGMSQDYEIAVKSGSNMVRIGTKLFF